MKEVTVTLKTPIEYAYKGEMLKASFVTIKPTTTKHIHLTSVLKQAFQVSAMKMSERTDAEELKELKEEKAAEKAEKDAKNTENGEESNDKKAKKDEKISPSDLMSTIYMGGKDINIKEIVLTGKELLTSGIVMVEGEEKLTRPLCDKLSQEDFEEILGSIMVNFIVASLLD